MGSLSSNKLYTVPTVNGDSGSWGTELNVTINLLDNNLGGTQSISLSGGNVAATTAQASVLTTEFSGALAADTTYTLPAGYGGIFCFFNATTGPYNVIVASGGGGGSVVIPQGTAMTVYSTGTDIVNASSWALPLTGGTLSGVLVLLGGANVTGALNVAGDVSVATSSTTGIQASITGSGMFNAIQAAVQTPGSQALAAFFAGATFVGSISTDGANASYNTSSDRRLKIDGGRLAAVTSGTMIDALRPRWFKWKDRPGEHPQPGFFAQEVERVFPWAVRRGSGRPGSKVFVPWCMDVAKLIVIVVCELQFLRRRVAELEKAVADGRGAREADGNRKRSR